MAKKNGEFWNLNAHDNLSIIGRDLFNFVSYGHNHIPLNDLNQILNILENIFGTDADIYEDKLIGYLKNGYV